MGDQDAYVEALIVSIQKKLDERKALLAELNRERIQRFAKKGVELFSDTLFLDTLTDHRESNVN